ncbi:MAG: hypothetical protein ACFFFH_05510 [Candidatus Thorarchaeota archaeon]
MDENLKIDSADVKTRIVEFIGSVLEKRGIDGLVVLYRDCLESITNVHLAIETVGKSNVKLLVTKGMLTNKQPREEMDLKSINKYLKLPEVNIIFASQENAFKEIQKVFSEQYDLKFGLLSHEALPTLNYNLSYLLLREMAKSEIEKKTYTPPSQKPLSQREKFIQRTIAFHKSQIRLRVLLAFLLAETENCSIFGNSNKTEWLLGLFTKFGTYHACDFLPLADLYRTQVIQLAGYLGLQEYLDCKKYQAPSIYKYFFNTSVDIVDRILIRLESGFSIGAIYEETGIPLEVIKKVEYYRQVSEYARTVPLIPELKFNEAIPQML